MRTAHRCVDGRAALLAAAVDDDFRRLDMRAMCIIRLNAKLQTSPSARGTRRGRGGRNRN
jgi:hypothetical protein